MIHVQNLLFRYPRSGYQVSVPDLTVQPCVATAIVGPSGSGKTTLLHLIAGILSPAEGIVRVGDTQLTSLNEASRCDFRVKNIGMVFQEFELIEYLSVLDNVMLPFRINPVQTVSATAKDRAVELLSSVGLKEFLDRPVTRLSQGERQRVAICRALIAKPSLLLADEPTGNLDPESSQRIVDLLLNAVRNHDMTLVMVTHDHSLLQQFDQVVDFQQFLKTSESDAPAGATS